MRLFNQFILRFLYRERVRSLTAILGIALGIAVILAIRMANSSSLRGFQSAVEMMAGETSLEITAPGGGVDEQLLLSLGWIREYGDLSPIIEGRGSLQLGEEPAETLQVLGVDVLRDRVFRDYRLVEFAEGGREPSHQEFLRLLADHDSIILTEKLARRLGIDLNDRIPLLIGDRIKEYAVRGLLKDEGPARALDGNFALMDIAAAQWGFDQIGKLTRVDVRLSNPAGIDEAEEKIAARLPTGLRAQRPSRRGRQVEKMLEAFHFNLTALSYIALLVGLFLIYNTVSVSVIVRRNEIGTLRALGTSRKTILGLFLTEAALLAVMGCGLGLLLARVLALGAVKLTATTVSVLYSSIVASPPPLDLNHVVLAFAIGLPLALLSALLPALEASRVTPSDAMRGADRLGSRFRLRPILLALPASLFIIGWYLSTLKPVSGLPLFGFLSALCITLGGAFLTPAVLFILGWAGKGLLRRIFKVEGLLAHANLSGSIPRLNVSVAALAVSLSMMVAIAVMVGSFRETVIYWVNQTLEADLFISPGGGGGASTSATISEEVEGLVTSNPRVEAIDRFHRREIPYRDGLVLLGIGDFPVRLARGGLQFKAPPEGKRAMREAIGEDAVVISESFALKQGHDVGDTILLPTARGSSRFRVAAVYFDYSSDRGIVVMDRSTANRHYGVLRPTSLAVYLREESDPDHARSEILSSLSERHRVSIYTNASIRREVLRVFDSTFAITYALEVIAIFIAILGVAATLVTLILERRRDLAVLRLMGADRRQVRRMVVIEAALMGTASQGIGLAVGLALSLLLIYVINVQSFGWTIQFRLPVFFLAQMSLLVMLATTLSGLYPARRACALRSVEQVVEE